MTDAAKFGRLDLAPIDLGQATAWVESQAKTGSACVVVTSNIHHLRLAEVDDAFAEAVWQADLNVADGWPLVMGVRLARRGRLPGRVAGVDLVDEILRRCAPLRVAILGGAPGAAERFAELVPSRHDVVLVDPLAPGTWDSEVALRRLCRAVERARPSLTLVAIGAPRRELLAEVLRPFVRGPLICCGAAVEILAGIRPRAPRLVRACRLEWAFRASREPARLGPRYALAGLWFLRVLARELFRCPEQASSGAPTRTGATRDPSLEAAVAKLLLASGRATGKGPPASGQ